MSTRIRKSEPKIDTLNKTSRGISFAKGKGKGKVLPRTGHEDPEGEQMYSSTLSLTLALDGVGGQRRAPATLPPGKTRYTLYRKLGGPQDRSGRVRKISPPHRDSIPGPSSP